MGKENCFIIAEFGMNHNGSVEQAKEGIRAAAKAGANAIKFQTYTADELVCKGTPKFWNYEEDEGQNQYEAYEKLGKIDYKDYPELVKCCEENNIEFMSTPFSIEASNFLNELGMKMFKVASSDLTFLPMIENIAKFDKPILLSTGASTMEEIHEAVNTIKKYHNKIIILHCTLCYPTKPEDDNLSVIQTLKKEFPDLKVGISDHTQGVFSSAIAYAMGADVIEKHFTIDKNLKGNADHWFSIDPKDLEELVCLCRDIKILSGSPEKRVLECEKDTRVYDKRSIVSNKFIPKDTVITEEMITWKRPGTGISPKENIIGKVALEDIEEDIPIQWSMIK